MFPDMAMDQMKQVLDTLMTANSDRTSSPHVLFHSFSVGGFLFGQCLRAMDAHPDTYGQYKTLIKAQIFDSPPDMGSIAFGISKGINLPALLEKPVESAVSMYLKATEATTGVHYEASRQAFYRNDVQAPALWFYSRADPISRWEDCEYVWKRWQAQGICSNTRYSLHVCVFLKTIKYSAIPTIFSILVISCPILRTVQFYGIPFLFLPSILFIIHSGQEVHVQSWEDTPHIQHGRLHPEVYFGKINDFLQVTDFKHHMTTTNAQK
jgi:hypothetical protein